MPWYGEPTLKRKACCSGCWAAPDVVPVYAGHDRHDRELGAGLAARPGRVRLLGRRCWSPPGSSSPGSWSAAKGRPSGCSARPSCPGQTRSPARARRPGPPPDRGGQGSASGDGAARPAGAAEGLRGSDRRAIAGLTPAPSLRSRPRLGQLFDQCVESLKQTDSSGRPRSNWPPPPPASRILDQREKLIDDVQASIQQLSDTLVALQRLGAGEGSSARTDPPARRTRPEPGRRQAVEERVNDLV